MKICVVDNFQGEENDIILLSLVRSNEEGKVGFLKTDNRVNVALSRARNALYIIGNMDQLSNGSELWQNIRETLTENKSIGDSLPLRCVNHPEKIFKVVHGDDFGKYAPEGGCLLQCSYSYDICGHQCFQTCHVRDMDHDNVPCKSPCKRKLCENDEHLCKKKCFETCGNCMYLVTKNLPCGHKKLDHCFKSPYDIKCLVSVERSLEQCKHINTMSCYVNVKTFKCTFHCDTRLDCGHQCSKKCHMNDDPEHENYKCYKDCAELNRNCRENHRCKKRCYEECNQCTVLVDKLLPCGHTEKNSPCHVPPEKVSCMKKCKKTLACSHPCPKKCSEPCGGCKQLVTKLVPGCNHVIRVSQTE